MGALLAFLLGSAFGAFAIVVAGSVLLLKKVASVIGALVAA